MADESSSKFKLDLDAKEFIVQANSAKGAIDAIGKSDGISGLIEGLTKVGTVVGVLGTAFFAIKGTLDAVFEAENIKAMNNQFDVLTQSVGIFGEELKKRLEEGAGGLVGETELLKAANKALVEMGHTAEKLPQVMELARKLTQVFGGDLISNFENINQAIATGNMRVLKHMGIIIDADKAYRDYAKSIGVAENSLSQAGKQQALMNAILDQGNDKFKNVDGSVKEVTNSWKKFKVSMTEVYEGLALIIDRLMGPAFKKGIDALSGMANMFKNTAIKLFGDDAQKTKVQFSELTDQVRIYTNQIEKLQELEKTQAQYQGNTKEAIENQKRMNAIIDGYREKVHDASQELARMKLLEGGGTEGGEKKSPVEAKLVDQKKIEENEAAFNKKHVEMVSERLRMERELGADAVAYSELEENQKLEIVQKYNFKAQEIYASKELDNKQRDALLKDNAENLQLELRRYEDQTLERELQNDQARLRSAKSMGDQMAASAHVNANKTALEWKKSGGLGGAAMSSFQNHTIAAFQAIGSGSKSVADAMKDAFMGALGEMATKQGTFMFLDSFKTFPAINVPEMGAGLALIALGGALGASGGGATSMSGGGAGGDIGSAASGTSSLGSGLPTTSPETKQRNQVNLIVQGHMLTDDHTARWIVDQVRNASDATGFSIQSVNGGFT